MANNEVPLENSRPLDLRKLGRDLLVVLGIGIALAGGTTKAQGASDRSSHGVAAARPNPNFKVGITTYSWAVDDPNKLFSDMKEVGLKTVRLSLYRERADSDLAMLQQELASAQANGVEVTVNLMQEPQSPIGGFPEWAAQMVVQLPEVKRFIIHNEVNTRTFWGGTVEDYVDTLHATYQAIKAVKADAVISGFGLASSHQPIAFLKKADEYTRLKYGPGGLKEIMDTLSMHIYNQSPMGAVKLIKKAEVIWKGSINLDEVGWQSPPLTEAQQAQQEITFLKLVKADPQVESVSNYHLRMPKPPDLQTGIENEDGSERMVGRELEAFLAQQKK